MFRIIHYIKDEYELIHITNDMNIDAEDYVTPGGKLISVKDYVETLPSSFPTESTFKKEE